MPSQQQLRWSQLKVGITVIVALVTLAVLSFLMSGTTGLFTTKFNLVTYFDDAQGLRKGQPVDLQGVQIGNVESVRVVPGRESAPVQVVMRINKKWQSLIREGATASVQTVGLLGESIVNIDSTKARGPVVKDGDELEHVASPGLQEVAKAGNTTLQNLDILVKRMDRIVAEVESGKGTLHGFVYDPTFINKANGVLNQVQGMLNDVNNGKGTVGKLFADETLYRKAEEAVAKINNLVDQIDKGQGPLGKLLRDETWYNNANQTIAKTNKLMEDLNAGRGTLGKLAKDEELARKVESTINKLSAIADRLERGEGTAGKFLRDPSLYNNSDQLLVETRSLIKAVRENPKKYLTIHLRIF